MNLGEYKRALTRSVMRSDIEDQYTLFINQAVQDLEKRVNWLHMRRADDITIAANSQFALMPSGFKELQPGDAAVGVVGEEGFIIPCRVYPQLELERLAANTAFFGRPFPGFAPPSAPGITWRMPVYVYCENSVWSLNLIAAAAEDITFRVQYFAFSPPMVNDNDTNGLCEQQPLLVLNQAKAIAFEDINDEIAAGFETLVEKKLNEYRISNERQQVAGTRWRM